METDFRGLSPTQRIHNGKVRESYSFGTMMLIVATDRISAFDWVMPNGIPLKGKVLTMMSVFWFQWLAENMPWLKTHFVTADWQKIVETYPQLESYGPQWAGRAMLVRKAKRVYGVEGIARSHLYGSSVKDYLNTGQICGISLPPGLEKASRLPSPLFTPSTKAPEGEHDENISVEEAVSRSLVTWIEEAAVANATMYLFRAGGDYAEERGIIIPDTKLEFGEDVDGRLMLVDEVLTPDSSRFWPAASYKPGKDQESLDKQFVREYLETTGWDKKSDPPALPSEVVEGTTKRYLEAIELLTEKPLDAWLAENNGTA